MATNATGIILRGETSSTTGYHARLADNTTFEFVKIIAGVETILTTMVFAYVSDENIWMRFDVADIAGGGVLLRGNVWRGDVNDEPDGFMLIHEEDTASIPSSGNAGYVGIGCIGSDDAHAHVCGYFRARSLFLDQTETLRYAVPTMYLPVSFNAIPSILDVTHTPVTLSLGEGLGQRAQVNVAFKDHLHADLGEFYNNGTYWGRFRAREIWRRGQPIRVLSGLLAHDIEDYEVRHLFLESFNGPTADDKMTMLGQDSLKFADSDKSQAPALNNGFLAADITNVQTTAQLLPSGIGDQEYATSGYLAVGGEEIVAFVRSGDSLVITRAQFGTAPAAHTAEDRVQMCLEYDADTAPFIIHDLLTNHAEVDSAMIDLPTWEAEAATYLQRQYSRLIAEPTGVKKLLEELIQQAGLILWNDTIENQIRFQVLRGISTAAFEFNEENTLEKSISVTEQRNKLITEAWVYYGVRNPLEPLDEPNNFRSGISVPNLEASTLNGQSVIKRIFGTWIATFGRDTAIRVTDLLLSRYSEPPRQVQFAVPRHAGYELPVEAGGYQFKYRGSQNELGGNISMPIQVTKVEPKGDKVIVQAEEMLFVAFNQEDLVNRVITVDANINDFNLKEVHDNIYPEITADDVIASPPVTLTVIVNAGVIVGSSSVLTAGFDVGELSDWPAGLRITIQIIGRIQGKGGNGGGIGVGFNGQAGGLAFRTRYPIDLDLSSGVAQIWGGGGGGAGFSAGGDQFGGGGGAGQVPGTGGTGNNVERNGGNGTTEVGGIGPDVAGDGGGPGLPGQDASIFFDGGVAGDAIDGLTLINFLSGYGDIRGDQIN